MTSGLVSSLQNFDQTTGLFSRDRHSLEHRWLANRARTLFGFIYEADGVRSNKAHQAGRGGIAQVSDRHRHKFHRQSSGRRRWRLLLRRGAGHVAHLERGQHVLLPVHELGAERLSVQTHLCLQLSLSPPAPALFHSYVGKARADRGNARNGLKPIWVEPFDDVVKPSHRQRASTVRSARQRDGAAA